MDKSSMKRTQHQLAISTSADEYNPLRLSRETDDHVVIARFSLPGEPVSKARARFTKYGSSTTVYTPAKTMQAEQSVAWAYRVAISGPSSPDGNSTFGVMAVFRYSHRQRRDVDNMLKLILDGLNGLIWKDDVQVTEVSGRKAFVAPGKEGTEVVVYQIGSVQLRTAKCQHCGNDFRTYPSDTKKRYCSDSCRLALRRIARRRTCENCGISWDPGKPSDRRFCSRKCQTAFARVDVKCSGCGTTFTRATCYLRKHNFCTPECRTAEMIRRRVKVRKGDCPTCGGPVSRKGVTKCRACRVTELDFGMGRKKPPGSRSRKSAA